MIEFAQWYAQIALYAAPALFVVAALCSAWRGQFMDDFIPHTFLVLLASIFGGFLWPVTICLLLVVWHSHWEDA